MSHVCLTWDRRARSKLICLAPGLKSIRPAAVVRLSEKEPNAPNRLSPDSVADLTTPAIPVYSGLQDFTISLAFLWWLPPLVLGKSLGMLDTPPELNSPHSGGLCIGLVWQREQRHAPPQMKSGWSCGSRIDDPQLSLLMECKLVAVSADDNVGAERGDELLLSLRGQLAWTLKASDQKKECMRRHIFQDS